MKDKVIVPDVLLQSHMASIDLTFYDGQQFPQEFQHDAFAAQHGSWNRERRVGYKVIRVPLKDGKATGEYEDFLVGFVTAEGNVWGRPAGVAVAKDGSLAMPAIQALNEGYDVFIVTDASGCVSKESHDMGVRRLVQAGAVPITWMAVLAEWQRDWARQKTAAALAGVLLDHGGGSGIAFAWEQQLLNTPVPTAAP